MNWVRIIVYVLMLILDGLSKNEAAAKASGLFDISAEEILRHM